MRKLLSVIVLVLAITCLQSFRGEAFAGSLVGLWTGSMISSDDDGFHNWILTLKITRQKGNVFAVRVGKNTIHGTVVGNQIYGVGLVQNNTRYFFGTLDDTSKKMSLTWLNVYQNEEFNFNWYSASYGVLTKK